MEWNEEGVEGTVVLDVDNLFFFLLFQLLAMEESPCDFDFFFFFCLVVARFLYSLQAAAQLVVCVCVCFFVLVVICSRLIRLAPVRATQTVAAGSRQQQQHQRERLTVRLGLHDRQTQTKGRTDGQTDGERGVPAIKSDVVLALVRTCSVCSLALFQNRSGK